MKLSFSFKHDPALAGLTRRQKQAVLQCALEAFYREDDSRIWMGLRWLLGGILIGGLSGWGLVYLTQCSYVKLFIAICAFAGAAVAIVIATQVHNTRMRPYLQRVLEERQDEIARLESGPG